MSVKNQDGVKIVTIGRVGENGVAKVSREREVSEKGIAETRDAILNWPFNEPWLHLKLPHKDAESWESSGIHYTAYGPEKVKVPAGTYETIRVEKRQPAKKDGKLTQIEWFAPRVGIVKLTADDILYEMKSFTPGKE